MGLDPATGLGNTLQCTVPDWGSTRLGVHMGENRSPRLKKRAERETAQRAQRLRGRGVETPAGLTRDPHRRLGLRTIPTEVLEIGHEHLGCHRAG